MRSSENTVFHLLQYDWQAHSWKITNETLSELHIPGNETNRNNKIWTSFQSYKQNSTFLLCRDPIGGAVSQLDKYPQFQDYNMLTDCSKVISENVHFWYLTTHRWRCSQLWHVSSDHGVDEAYQFRFNWSKFGRDTACEPIFGSTFVVPQHHNLFFSLVVKKFCSVISVRLGPRSSESILIRLDRFWRRSSENTVFQFASKWLTDHHLGKLQMRHR